MGPRNSDKEPPLRHHGSQRKPHGADGSRKNSLDDRGVKEFADRVEGLNIGARKYSPRVRPEDHRGRAKGVDRIGEDKNVQDKRDTVKDDEYGGRGQGKIRHKEQAHEDRKHKDYRHQERSPRDHRHKAHSDGDRRQKEHQRGEDRQKQRPDREDQQEKRPDRNARQEKHPNRDPHHEKHPNRNQTPKPHSLTEKEFNQKIYTSALLPFRPTTGTPYPTTQPEIDFHQHGVFKTPNPGPFVTRMQAARELLVWNDEARAPPRDELDLIRRLAIVVHDAEKNALFHADIVVKAFKDLDRVFFCGRLRGNLAVGWVDDIVSRDHDGQGGRTYGDTRQTTRTGQCRIRLNATAILLQRWSQVGKNSVACMFGTLLHEMCHAYDFVRCPRQKSGVDGHDEIWQTMIGVVHDRCCRILGTVSLLFRRVIPPFLSFLGGGGQKVCPPCRDMCSDSMTF